MNKRLLSTVAVLFLAGSTLNAAEALQVRLGMSNTSGTYALEDADGVIRSALDLKDGSGFEASLVAGVDRNDGFDFRIGLTLQSNNITVGLPQYYYTGYLKASETSDIMFLGEYEFAYNINKYISPFIGIYGGIGLTKIPEINESNLLTYDLGALIGISGEIYQNLGYYAKYTTGMKGYNIGENTVGIRQRPTSVKVGLSYTF